MTENLHFEMFLNSQEHKVVPNTDPIAVTVYIGPLYNALV